MLYHYVGPDEIREKAKGPGGCRVDSPKTLAGWIRDTDQERDAAGQVTVTFTVNQDGFLYVADRHSEHVACALGGPVLSAGEMSFEEVRGTWEVGEVTNQSTGFCPEPSSWEAVEEALLRAGVGHPGEFTREIIFRRCEGCGQRNLVKDDWFVCGVCGADLPGDWNF